MSKANSQHTTTALASDSVSTCPRDPVAVLARETDALLAVYNALEDMGPHDSGDVQRERDRQMGVLQSRLAALKLEASYRQARSPQGAAYQVMIALLIRDVMTSSTYNSRRDEE